MSRKFAKRKTREPFQEVERVAPNLTSITNKRNKKTKANDDAAAQTVDLTHEKKAASKILDKLLGGSPAAASSESKEETEKPAASTDKHSKKRKEVAVSSNWAKLKSKLPPPSSKKPSRPLMVGSKDVSVTETTIVKKTDLPTVVTFPSESEETRPTKYVALDCEMVGVGENGSESALARVSIVNSFGNTVYDQFVKPTEAVVDYRTRWSGIRKEDLKHAISFKQAQKEVAAIIKDRILVGHALQNDLKALLLTHPFPMMRDTSKYKPLMRSTGKPRALRYLARDYLGVQIQKGEHSSVEDAKAAMLLYLKMRKDWEEKANRRKRRGKSKQSKTTTPAN